MSIARFGQYRPRTRVDASLLLIGSLVSMAGSSFTLIATAVFLRPLGSYWVAAAMIAEFVPIVLGATLAGHIVDRFPARRTLIVSLVIQAAAAAASGLLGVREHGGAYLLVACLAALGCGGAVASPAVSKLLATLGGDSGSTRLFGWYGSITQAGFLAGAAAGGIVVQLVGVGGAMMFDAISFTAMAGLALFIRSGLLEEEPSDSPTPSLDKSQFAGLRRIWFDVLLRTSIVGLALTTFFSIVVNVADVFFVLGDIGASPATYGLVTASWPLAGIVGGLLASRFNTDSRLVAGLSVAGVVLGASLAFAGVIVSIASVLIAWLLGGLANSVQRFCILGLARSRSNSAEHGRVFAATSALLQAANIAGLVAGAGVVGLVGARFTLVYSGAFTVGVGGAMGVVLWRRMRVRPNQRDEVVVS